MDRYIIIGGRRFFYYDTYNTWREAYDMARYQKRSWGNKYWILQATVGLIPRTVFRLYLTKTQRI